MSESMRVLTVRQPWAWAIIHGGKDVENRVRNIAGAYRGPLAIHAGLTYDADAVISPPPLYVPVPFDPDGAYCRPLGCIIGVVDLADVHHADWCWDDIGTGPRHCSPWAEVDTWHLVLANPRPLTEPIPHRGGLGLRRLDPDTTSRVLAAIPKGTP